MENNRGIDPALRECLENNELGVKADDIKRVLAVIDGGYDDYWYWVLELNDGCDFVNRRKKQFALIRASKYYGEWKGSWATIYAARTSLRACDFASNYERELLRRQVYFGKNPTRSECEADNPYDYFKMRLYMDEDMEEE